MIIYTRTHAHTHTHTHTHMYIHIHIYTAQQQLVEQHRLLPIRSADSIGVRNRKSELERRIMEVDEAIQVFGRPRVFVRLDQ